MHIPSQLLPSLAQNGAALLRESLSSPIASTMQSEKTTTVSEHTENAPNFDGSLSQGVDELHGFVTDLGDLPNGYYRSSFFLGTMFAVGIGLTAAVGGFGLAAPALGLINSEIGPDPNISWVSFVYTLTLSIGLLLVGRLSDLFG